MNPSRLSVVPDILKDICIRNEVLKGVVTMEDLSSVRALVPKADFQLLLQRIERKNDDTVPYEMSFLVNDVISATRTIIPRGTQIRVIDQNYFGLVHVVDCENNSSWTTSRNVARHMKSFHTEEYHHLVFEDLITYKYRNRTSLWSGKLIKEGITYDVCIKSFQALPTRSDFEKLTRELIEEIDIFNTIGNDENIIKLIGVVTEESLFHFCYELGSAIPIRPRHSVPQSLPFTSIERLLEFKNAPCLVECDDDKENIYTEEEVVTILIDVTKGLVHLHKLNVAHRDIKLENIVQCETGIKIIDLAGAVVDPNTSKRSITYTDTHSAPEIMYEQADFSHDIWSVAVMGLSLCSGQTFSRWKNAPATPMNSRFVDVKQSYFKESEHYEDINSVSMSRQLREILMRCLAFAPTERPSAEQLLAQLQGLNYKRSLPKIVREPIHKKNIVSFTASNEEDLVRIYNKEIKMYRFNVVSLSMSEVDRIDVNIPYSPVDLFEKLYYMCTGNKFQDNLCVTLCESGALGDLKVVNIECKISKRLDTDLVYKFLNLVGVKVIVVDKGIQFFAWFLANRLVPKVQPQQLHQTLMRYFGEFGVFDLETMRSKEDIGNRVVPLLKVKGYKFEDTTPSRWFRQLLEYLAYTAFYTARKWENPVHDISAHPRKGIRKFNMITQQDDCILVVMKKEVEIWKNLFKSKGVDVNSISVERNHAFLRYPIHQTTDVFEMVAQTKYHYQVYLFDDYLSSRQPRKRENKGTDDREEKKSKLKF